MNHQTKQVPPCLHDRSQITKFVSHLVHIWPIFYLLWRAGFCDNDLMWWFLMWVIEIQHQVNLSYCEWFIWYFKEGKTASMCSLLDKSDFFLWVTLMGLIILFQPVVPTGVSTQRHIVFTEYNNPLTFVRDLLTPVQLTIEYMWRITFPRECNTCNIILDHDHFHD